MKNNAAFNNLIKELQELDPLITYLKETKKEDWMLGVCASKDLKKKCLLGHVFDWGG
jgi:hypothetical protein